jgi:hypothetical protein
MKKLLGTGLMLSLALFCRPSIVPAQVTHQISNSTMRVGININWGGAITTGARMVPECGE